MPPRTPILLLLSLIVFLTLPHVVPRVSGSRLRAGLTTEEILRFPLDKKETTHSPTIPPPNNLPLSSYQGSQLLVNVLTSSKSSKVLSLLQSLETQMNMGACALASAVTVLNAMEHRQPFDPVYTYNPSSSYAFWTQTSYTYDECVKKNVGPALFQGSFIQLTQRS
jgi:hypothetical protein